MRLDLILAIRDIYMNSNLTSLTKFINSNRSTVFKDIFPWNISQMITKTIPISTRIVISYAMKRDIMLLIWWRVNVNCDNNMIRNSEWRESHCRTNNSVRRKKEIQKSRTMRITTREYLSNRIWVIECMSCRDADQSRLVKLFGLSPNIKMQ